MPRAVLRRQLERALGGGLLVALGPQCGQRGLDGALEEVEDEVDELLLVTVVSLLLQAVRPRAPTRTIEPKATRLRKAVLDMVYLPVCFVTELPL